MGVWVCEQGPQDARPLAQRLCLGFVPRASIVRFACLRPRSHSLTGTARSTVSTSVPHRVRRARAGEWRRIPVAIKTVIFQSGDDDTYSSLVASEAAIASNLIHKNVVTTYSHDIRNITVGMGQEQSIYKFYLLQVRGWSHVTLQRRAAAVVFWHLAGRPRAHRVCCALTWWWWWCAGVLQWRQPRVRCRKGLLQPCRRLRPLAPHDGSPA
jgi:hypothetical protein